MKKLLSFDEASNLNIIETQKLYSKFISKQFTKFLNYFPYGTDEAKHSEGMYIYLEDGKKILDITGGNGVLGLGHNHPRILNVRNKFNSKKIMEVNKQYFSKYTAALAHNLSTLLPPNLDYSFFANSGAEAVDGAIKLAYKYHNGEKKFILASDIAFHGKLIGSGSLSKDKENSFNFQKINGVLNFEYNNFESVERLIEEHKNNIYALIVEPYSASTLQELDTEFLLNVRAITKKYNIVLIYDEIYSGWAKVGNLMNFMRCCVDYESCNDDTKNCMCENIAPDILTLSKTLGGGKSSISTYVTRKEIYEKTYSSIQEFSLHSTTYSYFAEEAATALEAINVIIEDKYVEKLQNVSSILDHSFKKLQKKFPNKIVNINGKGLIRGIEFNLSFSKNDSSKLKNITNKFKKNEIEKLIIASYISYLYDNHNILVGIVDNEKPMIRISPSNIINKNEILSLFDALEDMLEKNLFTIISKFIKTYIANHF
jgi:putrescine aminotransferase